MLAQKIVKASDLANEIEDRPLERNQLFEDYFTREARPLAAAVEILYHTLWETVHVFFEYRELGHDVGDAGFVYPFLGEGKQSTVPKFGLFGAKSCPYTREMRESSNGKSRSTWNTMWRRTPRPARMIAISGGQRTVPILAEDGDVIQIGWQRCGCVVAG